MDPLHEQPSSLSDRILDRVNALEQRLEYWKGRPWLWPMWLVGSVVLVMVLLASNFVAVLRWPFAASRARPDATSSTSASSTSASGTSKSEVSSFGSSATGSAAASQAGGADESIAGESIAGGNAEKQKETLRKKAQSEGAGVAVADSTPGAAGAPVKPLPVDSEQLERLLSEERVVLVDFWAPWCGPCIMMEGAIERLAAEVSPQCRVATLNTMSHHDVASSYGVRGLPTLILFLNGEEAARYAGALSHADLREWVERNMDRPSP